VQQGGVIDFLRGRPCRDGWLGGRLLWFWLAILCIVLTSSVWSQQKTARISLVIGNADYPDPTTPPPTTIADARSLADELRRSGFEVDLQTNLRKEEMQDAIDGFTSRIGSGVDAG
jgi:Caspase domain